MLKIFNKMTFAGLLALILGIYLVGSGVAELIYIAKPAVNLYETTDWSTLEKGTHVCTELDYVDNFFYYRYNEKTGKEAARAYMIPNLVFTEEGVYIEEYIGIMVKADEGFAKYDSAVQKSTKWWLDMTGEVEFPQPTIPVDGYLREMKDEERESLVKFISYTWEISEKEAEQYVCPYMIINCDAMETKKYIGGAFIIVLMGLGTLLWGVISGLRKR